MATQEGAEARLPEENLKKKMSQSEKDREIIIATNASDNNNSDDLDTGSNKRNGRFREAMASKKAAMASKTAAMKERMAEKTNQMKEKTKLNAAKTVQQVKGAAAAAKMRTSKAAKEMAGAENTETTASTAVEEKTEETRSISPAERDTKPQDNNRVASEGRVSTTNTLSTSKTSKKGDKPEEETTDGAAKKSIIKKLTKQKEDNPDQAARVSGIRKIATLATSTKVGKNKEEQADPTAKTPVGRKRAPLLNTHKAAKPAKQKEERSSPVKLSFGSKKPKKASSVDPQPPKVQEKPVTTKEIIIKKSNSTVQGKEKETPRAMPPNESQTGATTNSLLQQDPFAVLIILVSVFSAHAGCYSTITAGQVPIQISILWLMGAFIAGLAVGKKQGIVAASSQQLSVPCSGNTQQLSATPLQESSSTSKEAQLSATEFAPTESKIGRFMKRMKPRTTLDQNNQKTRTKVSQSLKKILKKRDRKHRRKSQGQHNIFSQGEVEAIVADEADSDDDEEEDEDLYIGRHSEDPEKLRASSMQDIEPMWRLRGLDLFGVPPEGQPDTDMATHPFLIEHGIRDRPTFIINAMTQWVNILIYFELPDWIQGWDTEFVEQDGDPENVIALKRFLNGSDEYRNRRFKVLPYLVDGPGPIRFMAPSTKKTATVVSPRLEARWIKHPPKLSADGDAVEWHPCLELEVDLMVTKTMRSVTSLLKRYLQSIVADCAIIIEKPYLQVEEEPTACLGMCRFDRVDLSVCPILPSRIAEEEEEEEDEEVTTDSGGLQVSRSSSQEKQDILRASKLMGIPVDPTVLES